MYAKYGKRILDLALASVGVVVIFVPVLVVALIIKLDSPGGGILQTTSLW